VTQIAAAICNKEMKIALIGHAKDHTSFYLKMFPQWNSIDVPAAKQLDATTIREAYFSTDQDRVETMFKIARDQEWLTVPSQNWLRDFQKTDAYADQVEEMEFYRRCKNTFAKESYPGSRNTVTGDALIIQAAQVLLIQRGQRPGIGQWALPGGHLNTDETVFDCALREGYEETGIKVPKTVFEKSYVGKDYFDEPRRDPRGRYITHTFMFHLKPVPPQYDTTKSAAENKRRVRDALAPPKVKGMDDAQKAKWVPLADLRRDNMFLDHYSIIRKMTAQLPRED
jgi:bifunctional NMN adenylyltransferase/nudix hydrolase